MRTLKQIVEQIMKSKNKEHTTKYEPNAYGFKGGKVLARKSPSSSGDEE